MQKEGSLYSEVFVPAVRGIGSVVYRGLPTLAVIKSSLDVLGVFADRDAEFSVGPAQLCGQGATDPRVSP